MFIFICSQVWCTQSPKELALFQIKGYWSLFTLQTENACAYKK